MLPNVTYRLGAAAHGHARVGLPRVAQVVRVRLLRSYTVARSPFNYSFVHLFVVRFSLFVFRCSLFAVRCSLFVGVRGAARPTSFASLQRALAAHTGRKV